ncbi:MAG: hypothetical protein ABSA45_11850 [Verrucomicrobiota bacterium]|jgi:hypothetical protein
MNKKTFMLVAVALVLAGVYAVYFTSWFRSQTIQISHTSRPGRTEGSHPLIFGLRVPYKLTEIKVVSLAEWQSNHGVPPVWHMVSDSNSAPVTFFTYGQRIRGMKPAVPGEQAQPLETNVAYRLFVTAVNIKGQHDFKIGETPTNLPAHQ